MPGMSGRTPAAGTAPAATPVVPGGKGTGQPIGAVARATQAAAAATAGGGGGAGGKPKSGNLLEGDAWMTMM